MRAILPFVFLGVVAASCLVGAAGKLPAFRVERWVNSAPLTAAGLRGKVVLVDFWEYTCINWIRTLPFIKPWDRDYAALGLVVIGVTERSNAATEERLKSGHAVGTASIVCLRARAQARA